MENASVEAMSLKSGVTKTLVAGGYFGRYLPENGTRGYLVYLHQGVLFGAAFDPGRLEVQGTPVPLLEDVAAARFRAEASLTFPRRPPGTEPWCTWQAKGRLRLGRWCGSTVPGRCSL